ncbi:hypothetical protein FE257_001206 [Aspergillus nanangensis]|uniref:NmrA-like domain-containing protein n=1 Tax=Aspergillus nanangensis TaxID=2582783 RepID=A0AAD4GQY9_ASPNN|nr:hypothetical protein FE257_001206 [Aspergillus nanangensis]
MTRRTIIVIGATGLQGGSVVKELLKRRENYHVRALTRDPKKPAAQALVALGVEVQQADLEGGSDSLIPAFAGADAIYALTDFWAKQSASAEIAQGKAIVDAASATSTLRHLIWSALPDPVKMSGGRFMNVHHWKTKSLVTEYIQEEHPALWQKTTTILFPNYFENCLTYPGKYLPKQDSTGVYTHSFPHSAGTLLPNVSIADTGKLVQIILEAGSTYFTKTIAFYAQALSESEKLAELGEMYNIPTRYRRISASEFQRSLETGAGMSEEIALDFTEQLMIFEECGNVYSREEFLQASEIPGLTLTTWSEFLAEHNVALRKSLQA